MELLNFHANGLGCQMLPITCACPKCGSKSAISKGARMRKTIGDAKVFKCKVCGRYYRQSYAGAWKRRALPSDLIESYFTTTLRNLGKNYNCGRSTVHREVLAQLRQYPSWQDLNTRPELKGRWAMIMGLDTTPLRIAGQYWTYLHVVDIPSHDPLVYQLLPSRTAILIGNALLRLRDAGYYPNVVVTDLAPELLSVVREVYPNAVIQGCILHLCMWLDKRLPTKRLSDVRKVLLRESVKTQIKCVAIAPSTKRHYYIAQLKKLDVSGDSQAQEVIDQFLQHHLQFYNPPDMLLLMYGCGPRYLYNNLCEGAMSLVRGIATKMHGFKKWEKVQKIIDAFWGTKRVKQIVENTERREVAECQTSLLLFSHYNILDLKSIATLTGTKLQELTQAVKKAGYFVEDERAFSPAFLDRCKSILQHGTKMTLAQIAKTLSVPQEDAISILNAIGVKVKYMNNLDPIVDIESA